MNPFGDRLGATGWIAAALVAVAAFVIGFMWLPSLQASAQGGLWEAICRAAGIYRPEPTLKTTVATQVPTTVAWDVESLRRMASGDVQRGSTLAAGCAGCHGAKGISPTDAFPSLAGLPADVIYKQLDDYRAGNRQNPIMQGMAAALSDQNIVDLAAYFAALSAAGHTDDGTSAPTLVRIGSPLRSIAPCAACHGPLGRKEGAPPLHGQKSAYLKAQLDAFAMGTRHNDINQQMREVARALSASERDALADWYGEARHSD